MRISDTRLELPREEPYMEGHNTWIGNHPGSLLAFPVADLAEHLMENLWFFAANGYPVADDINGRNIPGLERFSALPHADDPLPLSFVEQYTITEASAEPAGLHSAYCSWQFSLSVAGNSAVTNIPTRMCPR